jgi:hypothetical protein
VTQDGEDSSAYRSDEIRELYALAVEMADRVSARRATANTFFFTVQAGLAVSLGAFAVNAGGSVQPEPDRFLLFLAALAGLVIAGSWWLLLRSYRDLNRAKFEVILRIEREHLPVRVFDEEWVELKKDPVRKWRARYAEQGQVESVVPIVFVVLYLFLSVYVLIR